MSEHQAHASPGEPALSIPQSLGVAPSVVFLIVGALILTMMQATLSVLGNDFHVWPAAASTQVQLPPMNLR